MICPHCKKEIEAPESDANKVEVSVEGTPETVRATLERMLERAERGESDDE